ncbi:hypothetical protein GWI33_001434 [Rhynchophorus ferrugineus]|uniref:Uncharacterized protein n=1 Tax=Rhynchophorus ferrugineus TaxID=354439 RepID=A0A834IZZ6_RHYFE|nr:hypothetical protein GWI33_001434 [Rhynchophorus ferrugineus]
MTAIRMRRPETMSPEFHIHYTTGYNSSAGASAGREGGTMGLRACHLPLPGLDLRGPTPPPIPGPTHSRRAVLLRRDPISKF